VKNVKLDVNDNILSIEVDLSEEVGRSRSGKSVLVATSQGNVQIPGREETISLNVYKQESGGVGFQPKAEDDEEEENS